MPAKDGKDELHLLNVGKEVPIVDCQVRSYLSGALTLREGGHRLHVLVWEGGLEWGGGGGGGGEREGALHVVTIHGVFSLPSLPPLSRCVSVAPERVGH